MGQLVGKEGPRRLGWGYGRKPVCPSYLVSFDTGSPGCTLWSEGGVILHVPTPVPASQCGQFPLPVLPWTDTYTQGPVLLSLTADPGGPGGPKRPGAPSLPGGPARPCGEKGAREEDSNLGNPPLPLSPGTWRPSGQALKSSPLHPHQHIPRSQGHQVHTCCSQCLTRSPTGPG